MIISDVRNANGTHSGETIYPTFEKLCARWLLCRTDRASLQLLPFFSILLSLLAQWDVYNHIPGIEEGGGVEFTRETRESYNLTFWATRFVIVRSDCYRWEKIMQAFIKTNTLRKKTSLEAAGILIVWERWKNIFSGESAWIEQAWTTKVVHMMTKIRVILIFFKFKRTNFKFTRK